MTLISSGGFLPHPTLSRFIILTFCKLGTDHDFLSQKRGLSRFLFVGAIIGQIVYY
jgi:hypothetical protein